MPKATINPAHISYVFECPQCLTEFWVNNSNFDEYLYPCTCPHCECFIELPDDQEIDKFLHPS
jgi:DNA replicative helicase MCM subunit Mcm2 (Cdc46/Mcm family)